MSDIALKPEQIEIIEASGKNLLVSASAGSGKTTVMIERIFKMLVKREVKIENLLVLTYTTSAAEEMKQKLISKLVEKLDTYAYLEEEVEKVDSGDISTIHSFCQRLIRKNFHRLSEIDISFKILSNQEKAVLRDKAMKQTMLSYKKLNSNDYMFLLSFYGKERNDNKITSIVYELDKHIDAILDKEEFRTKTAYFLYENKTITYQILNENFLAKIKSYKNTFNNFLQTANNLNLEKSKVVIADVLLALNQLSNENDFVKNLNLFLSFKFMRKQTDKGFEDFCEKVAKVKSEIVDLKTTMKKKSFDNVELNEESFQLNKKLLSMFLQLQKAFEDNYSILKKQINALDFSDLERLAIKLTDEKEMQEELKNKYKFIFIDEYQDANQVQEKLIQNISNTNNRFMVGDVKQSIYGFRKAKPQIFLAKQKSYENEPLSENKNLNLNFRSDKNILEFSNFLFGKIMTEKTAGIDYKNKAYFKPFKEFEDKGISKVKVVAIKKTEKEKPVVKEVYSVLDQELFEEEETKSANIEATVVARDIELLKRSTIKDKSGQEREVRFKDITILVRKRGKYFDVFCQKLIELGVPIYANNSGSLFEEEDVKKFISLLSLSQNFHNDFALASVMSSFIGNFTYQELADIKVKTQNEKFFYSSVLAYSNQFNDDLAIKIKNFVSLVEEFFENVQTQGIYYALNFILQKTNYKEKVLCLIQGQQRLTSLEKFLSLFLKSEFNFNAGAFLEFVEIENKEVKAPNFFAGEEDCVNVTTIHSSKGLEYQIVFFVEAGSDFTKSPFGAEIKVSDELGAGLKYYNQEENEKTNSLVYEAIDIKNKKEEFAEKLRLFYVGLTRAIEYLFVYGTVNQDKISGFEDDIQVYNSKSFMDLILNSIDAASVQNAMLNGSAIIEIEKAKFELEFVSDNEIETLTKEDLKIVFSKGDKAFEDEIEKQLNYEYPYLTATSIALKNSVTSLLKTNEFESYNPVPQKLMLEEHLQGESVSQEEGIFYHKIFELINYDTLNNAQQIKEIIEKECLEKGDSFDLEVNEIFNFAMEIKSLINGQTHFKEKKFMMYVPYNSLFESSIKDKVLVQGIIDLFSIGKQNLLIDYKLTKLGNDDLIKKRYKKQIELYKKAIFEAYEINDINCFIADIKRKRLIKI